MLLCEEHSFQLLPILSCQSKEAAEEEGFYIPSEAFYGGSYGFHIQNKQKKELVPSLLTKLCVLSSAYILVTEKPQKITIFMVYSHIAQQTFIKTVHSDQQTKYTTIITVLSNNKGKNTKNRFLCSPPPKQQVKLF